MSLSTSSINPDVAESVSGLIAHRRDLGLSQEQAAQVVGISRRRSCRHQEAVELFAGDAVAAVLPEPDRLKLAFLDRAPDRHGVDSELGGHFRHEEQFLMLCTTYHKRIL